MLMFTDYTEHPNRYAVEANGHSEQQEEHFSDGDTGSCFNSAATNENTYTAGAATDDTGSAATPTGIHSRLQPRQTDTKGNIPHYFNLSLIIELALILIFPRTNYDNI